MEHNPDKMTGWIWVGFTGLVAVSLAVNGVQALAGSAKFAYWHLGTLAIGFLFSWEYLSEYLTAEQKAWIRGIIHRLWISSKKVAKTILDHSRDRLATFRSLLTNNPPKIQTEP